MLEQVGSLNPFEIRAGLKPTGSAKIMRPVGLNPFEIRAGLKPIEDEQLRITLGLNPFEIRAGLKPGLIVNPKAHCVS